MSYKIETHKTSINDAVSDAMSELQSLRDEMRQWAENMENNNLGSTPKFEEVNECADTMDGFVYDEPDVPDSLAQVEISYGEQVNRRKGKGPSRAVRCSNAVSMLSAVVDYCESLLDGEEDPEAEAEETEEQEDIKAAAEELRDAVQAIIDEAEGVSFPGMF